MDTAEQPTCGKGLAENSMLPAKLGDLIAAMAENLSVHMKALDLTDHAARTEYEAYESLLNGLRNISRQLHTTAEEMAGYSDLPMGKHDEKAMTHPRIREAFHALVNSKQDLMSHFMQTAEQDKQLLEMMGAHN